MMKIEKHPEFTPVTITLESQEEVDALFGLFNFATISGAHSLYLQIYDGLDNYKTQEYEKYFLVIDKKLVRRG